MFRADADSDVCWPVKRLQVGCVQFRAGPLLAASDATRPAPGEVAGLHPQLTWKSYHAANEAGAMPQRVQLLA